MSVFVKSFPRFSSELSISYKLVEHFTGSKIFKLLEHHFSYVKQYSVLPEQRLLRISLAPAIHDELVGVQAHVVRQLKGPHRVAST